MAEAMQTTLPIINAGAREDCEVGAAACFDGSTRKKGARNVRTGRAPHSARPSKQGYQGDCCDEPMDNATLQAQFFLLQRQVAKLQTAFASPATALNHRCNSIEQRQDELESAVASLNARVAAMESQTQDGTAPRESSVQKHAEDLETHANTQELSFQELAQRIDVLDARIGQVAGVSQQVTQVVGSWCNELKTDVGGLEQRLDKVIDLNNGVTHVLRDGMIEEIAVREQACAALSSRLETVEASTTAANLAATKFVQNCAFRLDATFGDRALKDSQAPPAAHEVEEACAYVASAGTGESGNDDSANQATQQEQPEVSKSAHIADPMTQLRPPNEPPSGRPHIRHVGHSAQ